MRVLGLPGRDSATRDWLRTLLNEAGFPEARVHDYAHWTTGEPDLGKEVLALPEGPWDLVVAKSLGTLVAARAVVAHTLRSEAFVLVGVPIAQLDEQHRVQLRAAFDTESCLFIQQTDDFTGAFAEVRQFASSLSAAAAAAVDGDDHRYRDVAKLAELISAWNQERMIAAERST